MRALDRKLFRDLWHVRTQALAIALVMAAGVAMFIMAVGAIASLTRAKDTYYERYRFAQVFASAKRVPRSVAGRIAQVPGIERVAPRIVAHVSLDVWGMSEPALARLISVPADGQPPLNGVYLLSGRWIDPDRPNEILMSESFAESHRLVPGDRVMANINGRRQELEIVGLALSPEYIIQIQPGSLLPDHRRFGIFWMEERQLAAAFDMEGAFNDVSLSLAPGVNEQAVIDRVDRLLEPFGGLGAYGRSQQSSHQFLSDEIRQLGMMMRIAPTIFLGVAAFLLNVVMTRLIGLQREQIAALKSFGYSGGSVGWHYLKFVMAISVVGTILGVIGGSWLEGRLARNYAQFYRFPHFQIYLEPRAILGAIAISVLAATAGALYAVRRATRLPPAEAMRPEPPARYGPTILERLGLGRYIPQVFRMILRQLERRPAKALTALLGIAMSVAILMMGSFSLDAIGYIMHFQFRLAQRQQMSVALTEPASPRAVRQFAQLPGVRKVQPFRAVSSRIRHEHFNRRVAILGIDPSGDMFRLLDVAERPVTLPDEGLVVSDKLSELLNARPGDRVTVEVLEGKRPTVDLEISKIVTEYGGANAYMSLPALHRALGETDVISGAFLGIDDALGDALYATLKNTPRVSGVINKNATLESFKRTVAENILMMRTFNIVFAVIIAFGVVFNSARISLSEQGRELATLRVIGFTRAEVSGILLGELTVLTLAAIPFGWLIGYGLCATFVMGLDTEMYRIPLVLERSTYAMSAVVALLAALVSGLIVRRRIDRLDLVAVLKTRE
jgi:putative ABC transport system permease protein